MRLKKLLISGFKSFVDLTDIRLPSRLVGVVGPNGCGKSNVIDAVRWVMGETSARTLRGDSMADVIFNGSAARKPVGKASVELVFDNSDGRVPGNYGRFAEISIKRTLTRDGQSSYHINNLKTRRRDVLDLFRGTGLGPRSYSIIEQGMVSRIVEAKPEELRAFVEEAAGTSRYKERRRETQIKITHTRENLERVADIREELAKQLRRLKRQSASARRYRALKDKEREIQGQVQLLKLDALDEQLNQHQRHLAACENRLEEAVAELRREEAALEALRRTQAEVHDNNEQIQRDHYQLSAHISHTEQELAHRRETWQQQAQELARLNRELAQKTQDIEARKQQEQAVEQRLTDGQPDYDEALRTRDEAEARVQEAETLLADSLGELERFNEQLREPAQQEEIQRSRMAYLEQNIEKLATRRNTLSAHIGRLQTQIESQDWAKLQQEVAAHDARYEEVETGVGGIEQALAAVDAEIETHREQLASLGNRLHEVISRHDSLTEIQRVALGEEDESLQQWLRAAGLAEAPRLAAGIVVEAGWEAAVDRVLGDFLGAITTADLESLQLEQAPDCDFSAVEPGTVDDRGRAHDTDRTLPDLNSKINAGGEYVATLLAGVFIAPDLMQALGMRRRLSGREIIVTPAGEVVGCGWCSIPSSARVRTGMLVREEELNRLQARREQIEVEIAQCEQQIVGLEQNREAKRETLRKERQRLTELRSQASLLHHQLGQQQAQQREAGEQLSRSQAEIRQLAEEIATSENDKQEAQAILHGAQQQSGTMAQKRADWVARRDELAAQVAGHKQHLETARERCHQYALERQKLESEIALGRETLDHLRAECDRAAQRIETLQSGDDRPEEQIKALEQTLAQQLVQRQAVAEKLAHAKDEVASCDEKINAGKTRRAQCDAQVNTARQAVDESRLTRQETAVRRDTLMEQIREQELDLAACRETLSEDAALDVWQRSLDEVQQQIDRIGPVNLMAIDEFDEESERMEYLERQHADLSEALETLETVMRKIDRETRTLFKETFERLNTGFNEFFPRLFGGGKAELMLTSEDLLTAGISVMARPPGKRNSHIHLLSGGEKALTAVAILFALFELNPSPFCMLDEVDAPLDDVNVDRYCETLKTLAARSQMIVITHNKITMEAVELLVGVTMAEPGVSRLVSVDIDQAMEMVAQ